MFRVIQHYAPHHALVEKIECEAPRGESEVVAFHDAQCLPEEVSLVKSFWFL